MNKLAMTFTATGHIDKRKQFVKNFTSNSASEVSSTANVMQWIEGSFDTEAIPRNAIDELVELAEVAEDKNKIALIDLFRLLVLKDVQAEYILTRHWELIEVCIIGYLSCQELGDASNKVIQNYHQMALKLLANIFATAPGKAVMTDPEKAQALVGFCTKSFSSCNPKVAYFSALVLFNYQLTFENAKKKNMQALYEQAFKAIDEVLNNVELVDKDTLVALLLAQCRLLFKNHDMTVWVETDFKSFFCETHTKLKNGPQGAIAEVGQALQDIYSMVKIEE